MRFLPALLVAAVAVSAAASATAQHPGSRNITVADRIPVIQAVDVEFDQDESRPFLYVADADGSVRVVSTAEKAEVIQTWQAADGAESHIADVEYFRIGQRHYLAAGIANDDGSGAVAVAEVTAPRRGDTLTEIARLRGSAVTDLFAYKHSSAAAVLAVADGGPLRLFSAAELLAANAEPSASVDTPEELERSTTGFDYVFLGFDAETQTDRLYGSGAGGYHVYDVTDIDNPQPVATVNPATIRRGGVAMPTPDGRYLIASAGYRGAPVRIFDLQQVYDGTLPVVRTAESAWAANWKNLYTDLQIRWPLVFVAGTDDGLQVFNIRDAAAPYTSAFYYTFVPATPAGTALDRPVQGAVAVDVRNNDGLIAVGDRNTGLWLFSLEAFQGWNGHGFGVSNMSAAQDWVGGPDRFGAQ
jgi:hypothetical protein